MLLGKKRAVKTLARSRAPTPIWPLRKSPLKFVSWQRGSGRSYLKCGSQRRPSAVSSVQRPSVQAYTVSLSRPERSHTDSALGSLTSSAPPDVTSRQRGRPTGRSTNHRPQPRHTGKRLCYAIGHPSSPRDSTGCTCRWKQWKWACVRVQLWQWAQ